MRVALNLASGTDLRDPPFVNLDIVPKWPRASRGCDIVWDACSDKIPFPDDSVDEIVAGYLFLHVSYEHHEPLAREMFRVMKSGGRLEVGEVDMPVAMKRWMANPYDQSAREILWGEQGSLHGAEFAQYDKHCAGHSEETLRAMLAGAGFVKIERFRQHAPEVWYEMSMRAVKP